MPEELVWMLVKNTGVTWEVTPAQAAELTRWYPNEYEIVTTPATDGKPEEAGEKTIDEKPDEKPATKKAK